MSELLVAACDEPVTLPPVEVRAEGFEDPFHPRFTRLETPVTPLGLVDKPALIKAVRHTLNAAFTWPATFNDAHHTLWPKSHYPDDPDAPANPRIFRNQPFNMIDLVRPFHNWTHAVTCPPPVPAAEVMFHGLEAQSAINSLHSAAQTAKRLARNPRISSRRLEQRLEQLYEFYSATLDRFDQMPAEFHFIHPADYAPNSPYDLLEIDGGLGRVATRATVATTTRYIRQHTFAPRKQKSAT